MPGVPFCPVRPTNYIVYRALAPLARRFYRGLGTVLAFHRVVDRMPARRSGYPRFFDITPEELERIVVQVRKKRYAILSLDETLEAMQHGKTRFCTLTFDDGYRDWATRVLPVLDALDAPFTLYVATGFPDRTVAPWGHLLERRLGIGDAISVEVGGRMKFFPLSTVRQRDAAFWTLDAVLEGPDRSRAAALAAQLFDERAIRDHDISISWEELDRLAAHRLVTIGAHTVTHPILSSLADHEVAYEMIESKRILERRYGAIRHFAYPYGARWDTTEREFRLAAECGFESAMTSRLSNVFPEHVAHPTAIPRIYGRTAFEIELGMSGIVSAIRYRGRRVVTS
jgi:peptidoglycan/xylan/chitin deacetylase (PgdA/CDA1 family)